MSTAQHSDRSGYDIRRSCLWCGDELDPNQHRFCSNRCEDQASRVEPCTYCGLPADSEDHVIPRAYRSMVEEHGGWRKEYARIADTVPACRQCNSIAGALLFAGVQEKRKHVHQRLREKYADVLAMPQWSDTEIAELGPSMRAYVVSGQELGSLIRARLRWPA